MVMHAHLTFPGRPAGRATVVDQVAREQTRFRGVSRPHDCHLDRCHSYLYVQTYMYLRPSWFRADSVLAVQTAKS
eukprot:COSAG03_NODE_173_length_11167_cov_181.916697_6_plen_75_part_00